MKRVVRERKEAGFEAARQEVLSGRGKTAMDSLRVLIGEVTRHEEGTLAERNTDAEREYRNANLTAVLSMIFTLLAVGTVLFLQGRRHVERTLTRERESFGTAAAERREAHASASGTAYPRAKAEQ